MTYSLLNKTGMEAKHPVGLLLGVLLGFSAGISLIAVLHEFLAHERAKRSIAGGGYWRTRSGAA